MGSIRQSGLDTEGLRGFRPVRNFGVSCNVVYLGGNSMKVPGQVRAPLLRLASMFIVLLGLYAHTQAQPGAQPARPQGGKGEMEDVEGAPERLLDMMDKRLKLAPEQKSKIKEILQGSRGRMRELFKRLQELRKEMETIRRSQMEKVRSLLDDEQKERFDEMRLLMRRRMGGHGEGPRPPHFREGGDGDYDDGAEGPHGPGKSAPRAGPQAPEEQDLPSRFPPEIWHEKSKGGDGK